ncbi:MAG: hypothetical protein FJY65_07460 [Calditrichaeota bacterium]|nr:hypothetical protein [Calditrichota bacterium]
MSRFPRTTIGWKWRALWGAFALDDWKVRAGKIISLLVILAFAVGATFFFHSVFAGLLKLEGIGQPLLFRILSISIGTIFALLVVSNLITGIATLYRSPEIPFLVARPVPYRQLFLSRLMDNLAYSSWSLLAIGVPLVIAWGWVFGVPFYLVLAVAAFGLTPLILIAAVVGAAALMALIWIARTTSPSIAALVVLFTVSGLFGSAVALRQRGLVAEGAARDSNVQRYLSRLGRDPKTPLLPTQWLAGTLRAVTQQNYKRAAFLAGLLTLTAVVWLRWLAVWAGRMYYSSWTAFGELSVKQPRGAPERAANKFSKPWLPNPLGALLRKDILMFIRSPSQWAQFLILVGFLLIYLLNLVYISTRFNFDHPYWKTMVLFLNFAFSGFILATLSVRFVYPLISLEGRGFWVVRKSPLKIEMLFWEKFCLAFIVFIALCQMIVYFSNYILDVNRTMMVLTTAATFLMGATLTGLSIGMGALFPDFKDESPMRIASTPGGVMTVVISLIYVGIMVALLGWPTRGYFLYLIGRDEFPIRQTLWSLAIVTFLNGLLMLLPMRFGQRALANQDL